jgi:hypothetical protein
MLTNLRSPLARMQDQNPLFAHSFIQNGHPVRTRIRIGTRKGVKTEVGTGAGTGVGTGVRPNLYIYVGLHGSLATILGL